MILSPLQTFLTILVLAFGSVFMRFLPPILFPNGKAHPKIIDELTPLLPPAIIGLLVVYCLKNVDISSATHALPELISIAAITIIHLWKKNIILSIAVGTVLYMLLIQKVFI